MNLIGKLEGHPGGSTALAFAAGGQLLVSAGEDGCAAVWRCDGRTLKARLACEGVDADRTPDGHTVSCVAVSPDGALAACAAGKSIHLFEPGAEDVEATRRVFPPVAGGVVNDLRFLGSGQLLAAFYGGVALFGTDVGVKGLVLEHGANILSASATPDLRWIVGGCMDATVHIWHLEKQAGGGPSISEATGPGGVAPAPEAAELSDRAGVDEPGGSSRGAERGPSDATAGPVAEAVEGAVAEAGVAGEGEEGDNDVEEEEDEYEEEAGVPVTVLQGPDGTTLEMVELTCGGYSGKVLRVDFGVAPDGDPLMASSGGNTCLIWNFGGAGPSGSAPIITLGHTKPVQCQAWHPSRPGVLVTGGRDGRLILYESYNAADGMEEGMPSLCGPAALDPSPSDEVVAVAWGSGDVLVSAHSSGEVKSWTWAG
ncbi:hypothetical protein MNEG_6156 [Monoraphidium neglectum]|uniref:Uncharacterized protein n=1 Tax=Monoraphidium neglectum TaxID=145388 RepID=A0A0D2MF83_9CHLO|nr:hypothetical protein MNEG_6156 [Monoraphidium neglectum]KIZ01805.1 hypothetical protein MNEG_6156 [Monoraphidium neglectum]|eukprot:XP_013900824.1 hypothetical protein MNEG_6156 [Monoraphidium neglectum]